jgi:hypothetical protein
MKNLIAVLFSLFLLAPLTAIAEVTPADSKQIDQLADGFFTKLNEHKTEEAYADLMLPLVNEQLAAMRNLYAVTNQVVTYLEKPFKYEKVEESSLGQMLVYRKYIIYNEKLPYVVTMVLFKTSAGWKCQRINLADLSYEDVVK